MRSLKSLLGRYLSTASRTRLWLRNAWRVRSLQPIPTVTSETLRLRGLPSDELGVLGAVFADAPAEFRPSKDLCWMYASLSSRLVILAEVSVEGRWETAGADLFYFNPRDLKESTVHEGLIFVAEPFRGLGVANAMRQHAMHHFATQGLRGISTRIRQSNIGSLRSAQGLGFKVVERAPVPNDSDVSLYLVCPLPIPSQAQNGLRVRYRIRGETQPPPSH
jgi:GNAT superfamily N-acetyltransferase